MSNLTSFVDLIVNETSETIQDEFVKVTDVETLSDKIRFAKDNLMELKTVIPRFATESRIRQLYDQHPNFVRPQSIVLGFMDEHALVKVGGESKVRIVSRPNTAQYCSIAHTLKNYLSDTTYFEYAFPPASEFENNFEIVSFLTAQRGKRMIESLPQGQRTIFIQIFFECLGLTGHNKNSASVHNRGMFYFTVLNFLAMCNTLDLKSEEDGQDNLLSKIVDEITEL